MTDVKVEIVKPTVWVTISVSRQETDDVSLGETTKGFYVEFTEDEAREVFNQLKNHFEPFDLNKIFQPNPNTSPGFYPNQPNWWSNPIATTVTTEPDYSCSCISINLNEDKKFDEQSFADYLVEHGILKGGLA